MKVLFCFINVSLKFLQSLVLIKFSMCLQCDNGWYGTDCSVPSVVSSVRDWPQWLRPAQIDVPDNANITGNLVNLNAAMEKQRPLIYVYDLPPEFNSLLLEVRMCILLSELVIFYFRIITLLHANNKLIVFIIYCMFLGETLQVWVCKQTLWWKECNSMDRYAVWLPGITKSEIDINQLIT